MVLTTRTSRTRRAGAALAMVATAMPCAARADGEVWAWTEHQVRLIDGDGDVPATNLRLTSNARFSGRGDGLDFGLVRAGPVFAVAPWLTVATTAAAITIRSGKGDFIQEYRGELDLVPHTKLGVFTLSDRSRFEYVWREAGPFTRYRNMIRVAYSPKGATWIPFAFFDIFLRPTEPHVQEAWSALGIGRVFGGAARLDVAYMLRARAGQEGELDHVTWLMLFFGAPPPKKPVAEPSPPPEHVD